jgi:integrase
MTNRFGAVPMQSLTPAENARLTAYLRETDTQDYLIWCLMQEGFLRVSEVLNLRNGDVMPDGRIICHRGKNSGTNILPIMSEDVLVTLRWLLTKRPNKSQLLFDRPRRTFDWRLKRAGEALGLPIEKMHAHAAKHTACMDMMVQTDGRIMAVKTIAGHRSVTSTLKYTNMTTEQALQYRKDWESEEHSQ